MYKLHTGYGAAGLESVEIINAGFIEAG